MIMTDGKLTKLQTYLEKATKEENGIGKQEI